MAEIPSLNSIVASDIRDFGDALMGSRHRQKYKLVLNNLESTETV